jgi:putative colanic acid biosynthesis acetyltransferase WcaF
MLNAEPTSPARSLAGFQGHGYDKGRPRVVQAAWFAVQNLIFWKWWLPANLRPKLLRVFGAQVGDNTWIGEDAWILNLEPVTIGRDVCISQGAFLCAGSHDMTSPTFEYDNGPIEIADEVWVGAQAMVLRGVNVGKGAVVAARCKVSENVPPGSLLTTSGLRRRSR